MDKQILLGDQIVHGSDRYGQWITENVEGWDENPTVLDSDEDRPNADGSFDMPLRYGARTPTIDGVLFADSRSRGLEAVRSLGNHSRLGIGILSITEAGLTQWANVKLVGLDRTWLTKTTVRWQLRLKAPDPFKYGHARTFPLNIGGSAGLFHRGNARAWPLVRVTGSFPNGYTLNGPGGKRFVVLTNPGSGTHLLDMRQGLLQVNGNYFTGQTSQTDVWSVAPGQESAMSLTASSGSGSAVITLTDTYI